MLTPGRGGGERPHPLWHVREAGNMCGGVFLLMFFRAPQRRVIFVKEGTKYTLPIRLLLELSQRLHLAVSLGVPLFSTVVDVFTLMCNAPARACLSDGE